MTERKQAVFRPDVYEVNSLEQAKSVIVTPEPGTTTDERWVKETEYLVGEVGKHISPQKDQYVLDYGCGAGRLSKSLVNEFGCRVVGVDASRSMRDLANEYVLSERFSTWSPKVLAAMSAEGFQFSSAICMWVLQHVARPEETIELIHAALAPGALCYVLNQDIRCVPTNLGYVNDGKDMESLLEARFEMKNRMRLPDHVSTPTIVAGSSIFVLRKSD